MLTIMNDVRPAVLIVDDTPTNIDLLKARVAITLT